MKQGYAPPTQTQPAPKKKKGGAMLNIIRTLYTLVIIIGLIGFVGVSNFIARVFFLTLVLLSSMMLYTITLKYKSAKVKVADIQIQQTPKPPAPAQEKPHVPIYDFVKCTVVGVTFKNGRRHRQTILRQIRWKDEPYENEPDITLRLTEYEGQPAVEVWADEEQIGYIPKSQAQYFADNWNRYDSLFDFEVYGGGKTDDGERISYGAAFTTRFRI